MHCVKKLLLISLIFVCSLCLISCSAKHNTQKNITLWTLQMGDYSDYMYKIIREYENKYPNIHIKWIDIPFSEGEKRTLAAIMTDNPPDLINLNPDFSALLAQKGTLEEIPMSAVEDFNQELINSLLYNGKLYSIPWYATSAITIYNKDLFSKSNIIRLPKTYNELASVAPKIKSNTGSFAFLPTITENDTMLKILNKYGISSIEYLNSQTSKEIFNMFKQMYKAEVIPPETLTISHREALEQYMAGKIVFYQGGANFLNMIKDNAPSIYEHTDVTEQFKGSVGQNDISVMNFVIPKKSKNKKEALDFCLYLTNAQNQLELAKMTNIIATNSNALNDEFYNDYSDLMSKARSISAKQMAKIYPQIKQRRNQKEINNLVNTSVQEILLEKASVDDVLNRLVFQLKQIEE